MIPAEGRLGERSLAICFCSNITGSYWLSCVLEIANMMLQSALKQLSKECHDNVIASICMRLSNLFAQSHVMDMFAFLL